MKYYSQIQQDKILNEQIFKNNKNGFFVDIGANHPTRHSNSYFFEKELNWKGICIEPQDDMVKLLQEQRSSIILNHGVYDKKTELQFCKTISGLSGIVETYEKEHIQRINNESKNLKIQNIVYKIQVDTLENVFDKYKVDTVDYMSLDTEGSEYEVLRGINYDKVKINIIDIEDNYPNSEKSNLIHSFLLSKKFKYIGNIQWDKIYMNNNVLFSWNKT